MNQNKFGDILFGFQRHKIRLKFVEIETI